jgi:hypothetical protein
MPIVVRHRSKLSEGLTEREIIFEKHDESGLSTRDVYGVDPLLERLRRHHSVVERKKEEKAK